MNNVDQLHKENYQMNFHSKQKKKKNLNVIKKSLFIVLGSLFFLAVLLLLIGKLPFTLARSNEVTTFNNVIAMGIENNNPRIIDIAMLGANEACSSEITTNDEIVISDTLLSKPIVKTFADGAASRYLRKQLSSLNDLLYSGVRYFDIKLVYYNDVYYTENIYAIKKIDNYLINIMKFLSENPKEFVILDFTRMSVGEKTLTEFYEYLSKVKYLETTVFDYIHCDVSKPINELYYNDVVGGNGGIILLIDTDEESKYHYNRNEVLISSQYYYSSNTKLLDAINQQTKVSLDNAKLRTNEAYLTPKADFNTIINWSILRMADWFNATILEEDLVSWFDSMPILVVDFADSGRGNFNRKINEYIIEYNKKKNGE